MILTLGQLKKAYLESLRSSVRPTELLLCTIEEGSVCSYPIKNSKSFTDLFMDSLPPLDPGCYYTFNIGQDPIRANDWEDA